MLKLLRSEKAFYFAVAMQPAIIALAAFGFVPRVVILPLFALVFIFTILQTPLNALRFLILSLPWYVALPLSDSYDRLQSWRLLIPTVLFVGVAYSLREIKEIFSLGLRGALGRMGFSKIDLYFLAFLIIGAISLAFTVFPTHGPRYLIWLFNIYLLFVAVRVIVRDDLARRVIISAAAWAGVFVVGIGFLQLFVYLYLSQPTFWQYWAETVIAALYGYDLTLLVGQANSWFAYLPDGPPDLRMFSIMPGSHYFALLSILVLPFWVYLREKSGPGAFRVFWTVAIALLLLGVIFTGVRGIWLSVLVPLVFVLALYVRKEIMKGMFLKIFVSLLVFLALFPASSIIQQSLGYVASLGFGSSGALHRAVSTFDLADTSNAARLMIWQNSLNSVAQNPIIGLGVGNFALVFGQPGDNQTMREFLSKTEPMTGFPIGHLSAHNMYLHILAETGLMGFLLFAAFLLTAFRMVWVGFKKNDLLATYFMLALVWILAYGVFDAAFLFNEKVLMMFWIGLGLLEN